MLQQRGKVVRLAYLATACRWITQFGGDLVEAQAAPRREGGGFGDGCRNPSLWYYHHRTKDFADGTDLAHAVWWLGQQNGGHEFLACGNF